MFVAGGEGRREGRKEREEEDRKASQQLRVKGQPEV